MKASYRPLSSIKDSPQSSRPTVSLACLSLICVCLVIQGTTSSTEPWYKTPYSWSDVLQSPESTVSIACHSLKCVCLRLQGTTSSTEPWYKTPYSLSDIPQSWHSAWTAASDDRLFLPHPNPFIPSSFDLIQVDFVAPCQCIW